MKLENKFDVPGPPEQTWRILLDGPRIVGCLPGAELVATEPDGSFKGRIGVKLGPIALKFLGTVTYTNIDAAAHTATINAKGSDQQGRGNAGAVTTMRVVPSAAGSTVFLDTEMQLSGLVAQYGRASGVISAVSNELIAQFASALRQQLTGGDEPARALDAAHADTPPAAAPVRSMSLITVLWRALLTKLGLRRAAS